MYLSWIIVCSLLLYVAEAQSQSADRNDDFHSLSSGLDIRIEPASSFNDISILNEIANGAFASNYHFQRFFPAGMPTQYRRQQDESMWESYVADPRYRLFKAVVVEEENLESSASKEKIVGGAIWDVFAEGRSERERKYPFRPYDPMEGIDAEHLTWYFRTVAEIREKIFGGKPYIVLDPLFVASEYQRKGIGEILLQWGINKGEEADLPVYLESTPDAIDLYSRNGFIALESYGLDPQLYGLRNVDDMIPMIRLPSRYGSESIRQFINDEV